MSKEKNMSAWEKNMSAWRWSDEIIPEIVEDYFNDFTQEKDIRKLKRNLDVLLDENAPNNLETCDIFLRDQPDILELVRKKLIQKSIEIDIQIQEENRKEKQQNKREYIQTLSEGRETLMKEANAAGFSSLVEYLLFLQIVDKNPSILTNNEVSSDIAPTSADSVPGDDIVLGETSSNTDTPDNTDESPSDSASDNPDTTPKYELTDEVNVNPYGQTLHRIRALKDFGNVHAGDLGGWIESENNLSQTGNCWVYDDAEVFDNAQVTEDAKILGHARVFNNARIHGTAKVYGSAEIYHNAHIHGNAKIWNYANIYGNAEICGDARICNSVYVCGDARVCNNTHLWGDMTINH